MQGHASCVSCMGLGFLKELIFPSILLLLKYPKKSTITKAAWSKFLTFNFSI